jgi:beta-N-acetylhexosaminidase
MKTSPSNLTLEQKVGQMFIAGFPGTKVTPEVKYLFRDLCFGGVILFKRNMKDLKQTKALIRELQEIAQEATGLPLFVAVDEEGGPIVRLPKGATIFPGPMALAATKSVAHVKAVARATARELQSLGFNLNFAPVVDVATEPTNPVIGVRAFSSDPRRVGELGATYIQAHQAEGVLATAKHFPGLGSATKDPHATLPALYRTRGELEETELPPFRAAVRAGVSCVMVSNAWYPRLVREPGIPACFSPRIVSGLLRKEFGFPGLIVTDDLAMGAVAGNFPGSQSALSSLHAGCDLLLIGHDPHLQALARKSLLWALNNGQFSERRLEESLGRIREAKSRLASRKSKIPLSDPRLAQQVIEQSLTLLRNDPDLLPLPRKLPGPLGLIFPEVSRAVPMDEDEEPSRILEALLSPHYSVKGSTFGFHPSREEVDRAKALAASCALVILGTYTATLSRGQTRLIRLVLIQNPKVIQVSLRNPYDLVLFPQIPCALASYSFRPPAMEALAKVLLGKLTPKGTLPVSIPGI